MTVFHQKRLCRYLQGHCSIGPVRHLGDEASFLRIRPGAGTLGVGPALGFDEIAIAVAAKIYGRARPDGGAGKSGGWAKDCHWRAAKSYWHSPSVIPCCFAQSQTFWK